MLRLHVKAVNVIQPSVPRLRNHWERPILLQRTVLHAPGDDRITHHAHAVRIGDGDGGLEEPGLLNPCRPGHLAIAVLLEPSRINRVKIRLAARKHYGNSGPHWAFAHLQRAVAGDQRRLANLDAANVGDGVERSRRSVKGYAKIASPRCGLRVHCGCRRDNNREQKCKPFSPNMHAWKTTAQFRTTIEESCA